MGPITSLRDIPRALKRRMWLILLVLVIGLPGSVWFALSKPRLYEATAAIQIEVPQVAEGLTGQTGGLNANGQLDLIEQQLMSRDHMIGVIEDLNLFPGDITMVDRVSILRGAITIVKIVDPEQAWRPDVDPSGLIITVRLAEAQRAADVANYLLNSIIAEAQRRSDSRAARTLEFFTIEEARVVSEIEAREADFVRFQQANSASLPAAITAQRTQLARLVETQITLEQQLVELEAGGERLRAEDATRRATLLNQQLGLVQDTIANLESAIANAPEVERQINAYQRELDQLQEQYSVITTRRTEAAMTQLLESRDQAERFEVLETAIVPDYPVSASRRKMAMAGGVLVVFLALGLAMAMEMADGSIRTAAQLERELGVQPVVVIPDLKTRGQIRRGHLGLLAAALALLLALLALFRGGWQLIVSNVPFLQRGAVGSFGR